MILEPRGSCTHPGDRLMSNDSVKLQICDLPFKFSALVVINLCYSNKVGI